MKETSAVTQSSTAQPGRRRQYVVEKEFQADHARFFALHGVLSGFAATMTFAMYIVWAGGLADLEAQRFIPALVLTIMLANIVASYFIALRITNRVAGPLFNLRRQFGRIARGNFDAWAKFRKTDYFSGLSMQFNTMVNALRERDARQQEMLGLLKEMVDRGELESSRALLRKMMTYDAFKPAASTDDACELGDACEIDEPDSIAEVVCSRNLEFLESCGSIKKVEVSVYKPVPADGGGFKCEVRIDGLEDKGPPPVNGEDSMQSLVLALSLIGTYLASSDAGRAGQLRWLGMHDLGFPSPAGIPPADK